MDWCSRGWCQDMIAWNKYCCWFSVNKIKISFKTIIWCLIRFLTWSSTGKISRVGGQDSDISAKQQPFERWKKEAGLWQKLSPGHESRCIPSRFSGFSVTMFASSQHIHRPVASWSRNKPHYCAAIIPNKFGNNFWQIFFWLAQTEGNTTDKRSGTCTCPVT